MSAFHMSLDKNQKLADCKKIKKKNPDHIHENTHAHKVLRLPVMIL
jgi:hypothetical protein